MNIVILSGAGISAESGIRTFRDAGGLWEGHSIEDVATPGGFERNPKLVLDFYNDRRRQLLSVAPNPAHYAISDLAKHHTVSVITQNVDDLHERAGNDPVLHLHGELKKVRSTRFPSLQYHWEKDLNLGDLCEKGYQMRPDIVWFGEDVPKMEEAIDLVGQAELLIIVGTSMQVYPAAGLIHASTQGIPIYYIDPNPAHISGFHGIRNLKVIPESASAGMVRLVNDLK